MCVWEEERMWGRERGERRGWSRVARKRKVSKFCPEHMRCWKI